VVSGRRALVIGTQCASLAGLSFLPQAARDLHEVLRDPTLGNCHKAQLLLDPTVLELDAAVEEAVRTASDNEESMIIAIIGHGEYADEDFYVMAQDSSCPANSARAYLLAQRIKEAVREYSLLDGLILLLDTCHAGIGAAQAAQHWVRTIGAAGRRFKVLTASDERTAAGGCFSRSLAAVLRKGHLDCGDRIRCSDLKPILTAACPHQTAQYLSFDGDRAVRYGDDASWLAHNAARASSVLDSTTSAIMAELTRWYVPTPAFAGTVRRLTRRSRCVTVTGPGGSGKSTLLAALATERLVDAVAFPAEADSPDLAATVLARQLTGSAPDAPTTVPEFENLLRTLTGRRVRSASPSTPRLPRRASCRGCRPVPGSRTSKWSPLPSTGATSSSAPRDDGNWPTTSAGAPYPRRKRHR
jgi:Caspase domain